MAGRSRCQRDGMVRMPEGDARFCESATRAECRQAHDADAVGGDWMLAFSVGFGFWRRRRLLHLVRVVVVEGQSWGAGSSAKGCIASVFVVRFELQEKSGEPRRPRPPRPESGSYP